MPKLYSQQVIDRARADFLAGGSCSEIAKMNNIKDPRTVNSWAHKHGWWEERERLREVARVSVENKIITEHGRINLAHLEIAESLLNAIRQQVTPSRDGKYNLTDGAVNRLAAALERTVHVRRQAAGMKDKEEQVAPAVVQVAFGGLPLAAIKSQSEKGDDDDVDADAFSLTAPPPLSVLDGVPADGSVLIQPPASATADRDGVGLPESAPGAPPPKIPGLRPRGQHGQPGHEPPDAGPQAASA